MTLASRAALPYGPFSLKLRDRAHTPFRKARKENWLRGKREKRLTTRASRRDKPADGSPRSELCSLLRNPRDSTQSSESCSAAERTPRSELRLFLSAKSKNEKRTRRQRRRRRRRKGGAAPLPELPSERLRRRSLQRIDRQLLALLRISTRGRRGYVGRRSGSEQGWARRDERRAASNRAALRHRGAVERLHDGLAGFRQLPAGQRPLGVRGLARVERVNRVRDAHLDP